MIARLTGRCVQLDPDSLVVDVGGVGYLVRATTTVLQAASRNPEVVIHTYLQVREDAMTLFGFASGSEQRVFEQLILLQGVGPKVAMGIVSALSPADIRRAADTGDTALLESVQGVGPKVARRIVTELKDKLDAAGLIDLGPVVSGAESPGSTFYEAREALIGLGLSLQAAEVALGETSDADPVDVRIRQALQAGRS